MVIGLITTSYRGSNCIHHLNNIEFSSSQEDFCIVA